MSNKKKILKKYQFFLIDLDGVIFDSKKNVEVSVHFNFFFLGRNGKNLNLLSVNDQARPRHHLEQNEVHWPLSRCEI